MGAQQQRLNTRKGQLYGSVLGQWNFWHCFLQRFEKRFDEPNADVECFLKKV